MPLQFRSEFYIDANYKQVIDNNIDHGWAVQNIFDNAFLKGVVITYVKDIRTRPDESIKSSLLRNEFEAWADTLKRDSKYAKRDLYHPWVKKYPDLSPHQFTRQMKEYCSKRNIQYLSRKGNSREFVWLSTTGKINDDTILY